MTKQETLKLLWEKYVSDQKLSAREIRQLKALVQDKHNQELLMELLNSVYEQKQEIIPAEYSSRDAFKEVWARLQSEKENASVPVIPITSRRQWWKYAAAAIIVLAAGLGIYQWTGKKTSQPVVRQQDKMVNDEIVPGGNKAMLMLSDGSVIALNDAENGMLTKQGGAKVVKLADGELAYETDNKQAAASVFNTIVTPRGGKYQLTLPDGSKVWMNAESTLRYPTTFNGKTREVFLTGEAYFEIAHNPAQPFHVQVNDMKVEVLGTHFNIMAYENEAANAVTLVEGAVSVSTPAQQVGLKPGEQMLQESNGNMNVLSDVNVQQVLAWKNGYFQFNSERLDRLMRQIERWYDVSVVYKGTVPDRKFGGKISRSSPLNDVLKALELSDIKFLVEGKTITVINN